ncbi:MAG: hypothetical protein AB7I30_13380 [Isosphaeraceae bacterium]
MEHLDHRQLLSVTFTGNVATDFPLSMTPGVVNLPDNANVKHPPIAPNIAPIVKVSGFDVTAIRVTYTPDDDTLSIGLDQPPSNQVGQPGDVIAGDADNNGNDGTVNPDVLALNPTFEDYPDFGGSEYMGAFLDLTEDGFADVVAGYAINDPRSPKQYQVADAIVNTNGPPNVLPDFGTALPQFIGNIYKLNSPANPNLEFAIKDFSQLYLQETGKTLGPDSEIGLGAFGGSAEDTGIGEAFFPLQNFRLGDATPPPPPPPVCPPVSPPIYINPHSQYHVNTAHPTNIRVNILGSSGFDVSKIDPSTVTLGGATPISGFQRLINADQWPDATFVFQGNEVDLPGGFTDATVSGELTDGTKFSSTVRVFNRNDAFYGPGENSLAAQRTVFWDGRRDGFTIVPSDSSAAASPTISAAVPSGPAGAIRSTAVETHPRVDDSRPRVTIPRREPVVSVEARPASEDRSRIQSSLDQMLDDLDVSDLAASSHGAF